MLPIADTNILLRFLLNDDEGQHDQAEEIIERGCETTPEVLSEVAYVLCGRYRLSREEAGLMMLHLIERVHIEQRSEMFCALMFFCNQNLDFVDCVLEAKHVVSGRRIETFDKKLLRLVA